MSIIKEKGLWALTLLGLVFFFRPLFLDETFFFRDIYLYYIPIKKILVEVLRSGQWPFWNAYLHGGQPLLADISTTVFYPSVLLYLVFPAAKALTLDIVIHALSSAAALYLLARRLGLGQPAAALGGAVYGYCGYTLSQGNLYFRLLATPYLPLMLLCWHAYLLPGRPPRRRWLTALLALGLLQLLAGSAEMVAFTWLTLLGWGLFQSSRLTVGRKLRGTILLGLCVAGLAAPQLVPLVEMVGQSQRGAGMEAETFTHWSLDPRRLPELAVPGFMGRTDTLEPTDYWGARRVDSGFPFMLSLYLGALVLGLALASATARGDGVLPRRLVKLLLLLTILGVLLSLGRFLPFFELFYQWVPGAQLFRYPIKLLTLGILPVALLAADGIEALIRADRRRRRVLLLTGWSIAGAMGLFLLLWIAAPAFAEAFQVFFFGTAQAKIESGLRHGWIQMTAVWLTAILVYQLHHLTARGKGAPRTRARDFSSDQGAKPQTYWSISRIWQHRAGGKDPLWAWVLAGLVAFDLMLAGRQVNPTVPIDLVSETPPAASLVSKHLEGGRFYRAPLREETSLMAPSADIHWFYRWTQEVLRFYLAASYRIPVIFHLDYDGLAPSRVMKMKWTLEAVPWEQRLALLSAGAVTVFITEDEIDLPGVEQLGTIGSSSQPFHVYRNDRAAGRLELVSAYHRVASEDKALSAMLAPDFDPRQHAVVEGEVPEAAMCRGTGRAVVSEESFHHRRTSVSSECPGLLVLSEVHYPGWQARVDGEPTTLLRANGAFSAVWLAAGEHEVEWRFVPRSFYLGLLISGATLGVLIWLGCRRSVGSRSGLAGPDDGIPGQPVERPNA